MISTSGHLQQAPCLALFWEMAGNVHAERSAPTLEWANSTLLGADIVSAVAELRERHSNVHVIGSLDLVQTLVAEGLLDRLTLWIYPILLGTGKHVFAPGTVLSNLTPVEPASTSPQRRHPRAIRTRRRHPIDG
jgi:dihydrofolate reductase